MSITLGSVTLPDDLVWSDEFSFDHIAQTQRRTVTGALVITESAKLKGRPFSLDGKGGSWITRAELISLKALADQIDEDHLLVFHGESYIVRFNRLSSQAVQPKLIRECSDPSVDEPYTLNIKLIEIDASSIGSGSADVGFVGLGSGTI